MPECEKTFQLPKEHLKTLSPLAKPMPGDTLFLYLSISHVAVRFVLVKEETRGQVQVYSVRKVVMSVEMKCLEVEKYFYGLVA